MLIVCKNCSSTIAVRSPSKTIITCDNCGASNRVSVASLVGPVSTLRTIIANEFPAAPFEPTKEARFIISSLAPNVKSSGEVDFFKFAPNKFYKSAEDAERACNQYLTPSRPMYVLEVVKKVELTPPPPPPTIVTSFKEEG